MVQGPNVFPGSILGGHVKGTFRSIPNSVWAVALPDYPCSIEDLLPNLLTMVVVNALTAQTRPRSQSLAPCGPRSGKY